VRTWRPFTVLGPPEVAERYRFLDDPGVVLEFAERERAEELDVWFQS
jgi:hypothetical protein